MCVCICLNRTHGQIACESLSVILAQKKTAGLYRCMQIRVHRSSFESLLLRDITYGGPALYKDIDILSFVVFLRQSITL